MKWISYQSHSNNGDQVNCTEPDIRLSYAINIKKYFITLHAKLQCSVL